MLVAISIQLMPNNSKARLYDNLFTNKNLLVLNCIEGGSPLRYHRRSEEELVTRPWKSLELLGS